MNLSAAKNFIATHGSLSEQASLRFLISGDKPSQLAVDEVLQSQRSDGSWSPFWATDYGSLDATCYRLALAHSMGVGADAGKIRKALEFIRSRQQGDGRWEEDPIVADVAPPWATPGELAPTLYLTANCGWWISLHFLQSEHAERAAAYLAAHLDDSGRLPSFMNSHWLAAGLWLRLGRQDKAELTMRYLLSRVDEFGPGDLSWLLTALLEAGSSASHVLNVESSNRLAIQQRDDGSWQDPDGASSDSMTTIDAIRSLYLAGYKEDRDPEAS